MSEKDFYKKIFNAKELKETLGKKKPVVTKQDELSHLNFDSEDIVDQEKKRKTSRLIHGFGDVLEKADDRFEGTFDKEVYKTYIKGLKDGKGFSKEVINAMNDSVYGQTIKMLFDAIKHRNRILEENQNNLQVKKIDERINRYVEKLQNSDNPVIRDVHNSIKWYLKTEKSLEIHDPKDPSMN